MSLFSRNETRREREQPPPQPGQSASADHVVADDSARAAERSMADSRVGAMGTEALARYEQPLREEQRRRDKEASRAAEKNASLHELEKTQDQAVEDAVVTREHSAAGDMPVMHTEARQPAPLFSAETARDFRLRWNATQIGFVDDPRLAVKQAEELVELMVKSLAKSFADERAQLESQTNESASTENLRVALQRYRWFYQRLLSL